MQQAESPLGIRGCLKTNANKNKTLPFNRTKPVQIFSTRLDVIHVTFVNVKEHANLTTSIRLQSG